MNFARMVLACLINFVRAMKFMILFGDLFKKFFKLREILINEKKRSIQF